MEVTGSYVMQLTFQAFLILLLGLVLWRFMVAYSKRSSKPKGSSYFDTKYKDKWKRKS